MTYAEQLRHPQWQRRRLQVLDAAGWRCTCCSADDKPLHVHHRLYVKGRLAWEYSDAELVALCEDCHEHEHEQRAELEAIIGQVQGEEKACLVEVVRGYAAASTGARIQDSHDPVYFMVGEIARKLQGLPFVELRDLHARLCPGLEA
jgi:hypothetical protein